MQEGNPRPVDQARRTAIIQALAGAAGLLALVMGAYVISPKYAIDGATESILTTRSSTASETPEAAIQPGGSAEVNVRVVYFGMPPTVTGARKETIVLGSPAYLSDLEAALVGLHPALKGMLPTMLFLVDGVSANGNPQLQNDVEVDVLAQVAGG